MIFSGIARMTRMTMAQTARGTYRRSASRGDASEWSVSSVMLGARYRRSKHHRHAFVKHSQFVGEIFLGDNLPEPARRFVHRLEPGFERPVMHWHEPARAKLFECLHRLVRPHVDAAERFRKISANRHQRDSRREPLADFLETVEIRAVTRVINLPPLMFQDESAIAAML